MKINFWHHNPFIGAVVVSTGVVLSVINTYFLLDSVPDSSAAASSLQLKLAIGIVLWILGCGIVSRTRHGSWKKGIFCSLFLLPGLLWIIFTTGGKTRQEMWALDNPNLAQQRNRRQFRDVKPLY